MGYMKTNKAKQRKTERMMVGPHKLLGIAAGERTVWKQRTGRRPLSPSG